MTASRWASLPSARGVLRRGVGVTALLLVIAVCVVWAVRSGHSPARQAVPASARSADPGALLSTGRREIAELSGADADRSRRLDDSTGALRTAVARESTAPAAATAAPGTVTAAAVATLDADAGTAVLIATMQLPASGEQRVEASMARVAGAWKVAALTVVPVGGAGPAPTGAPTAPAVGVGVTAAVADDLHRILSYSPAGTAGTRQAADQVLAGAAAVQYRQLFDGISAQVRQQGLTVDSRVVRIGVEQQTADRAQLLVFLDQTAQRTGRTATRVGAQLSVTAQLSGGHWRIVELTSR